MTHHTHPDIVKRLRRAQGHLTVTIRHLEEGRGCADLAQQLHAVEKAIGNAKKALIHDHINRCLDKSVGIPSHDIQLMIEDFKNLSKYL